MFTAVKLSKFWLACGSGLSDTGKEFPTHGKVIHMGTWCKNSEYQSLKYETVWIENIFAGSYSFFYLTKLEKYIPVEYI
jgi:hypothetical protein